MDFKENCKNLFAAPHKSVCIDDEFWSPKLQKMREITLKDVLDKFEYDGGFSNFNRVYDGKKGEHSGGSCFDGLIYETICAASDFLIDHYDDELVQRLEKYIRQISDAQDKDSNGYINTYTTLMCPENRWGENGGDEHYQHDLYNSGCLVEAGVHYYKSTNNISLLKLAVKLANFLCTYIGLPPKNNIMPGHPLPEKAFVELYRLFKNQPDLKTKFEPEIDEIKYLELAEFWIYGRGQHKGRKNYPRYLGECAQDHRPLLEQEVAVGHAVRATLLYNGLIAVAMETGKQAYFDTSEKLWNDVVEKKLQINGGVGAIHSDEKFGYEYQLPNDAYLETCAAVGMAFWSENMNLAFADAKYMDVVEMALYNGILSGLSLDGKKYFYQNPLISDGNHHRWEWHKCPCCPPMLLKIMSDLQSYIYSLDDNSIFINLYIGGSLTTNIKEHKVILLQETKYPWNGTVKITVKPEKIESFDLNLRIPGWCEEFKIIVNGKDMSITQLRKNYAVINKEWTDGDEVILEMTMPVLRIEAHPYVKNNRDKVALKRGPILYCLEDVDNENNLDIELPAQFDCDTIYNRDFLGGIVLISGYDISGAKYVAIPYYSWDNRKPGKMNVWLRQKDKESDHPSIDGWERKLYRPLKSN